MPGEAELCQRQGMLFAQQLASRPVPSSGSAKRSLQLLPPVLQPQLFSGTLSALAGPQRQPAVVDAAAQVLLLLFGAETFSGNSEDAERAATASTLSALVSLRHRLGPPEAEGVALGVTQLGSALAERSPEWCGGELPQVRGWGRGYCLCAFCLGTCSSVLAGELASPAKPALRLPVPAAARRCPSPRWCWSAWPGRSPPWLRTVWTTSS